MELAMMSQEMYEESIRDHVSLKLILEYLDECESENTKPDIEWLRYLMKGCDNDDG